jgi:formate dehydrogenase major subunit
MSAHNADCVAPCRLQCPDNIDIQTYIAQVAAGDTQGALQTIKRTNPFPSVCGRVCPHTCEIQCRRNLVDEAVAINPLKRYVADLDLASDKPFLPACAPDTGKQVAVIGAGPAGLTAAYYLRQKGHSVCVFEMNAKPGGMLHYGIPRYRLPDKLLEREIEQILSLGIELRCNQKLGRDFDLPGLRKNGFDAVFLGVGAWSSSTMRVEGENQDGVMAGIDYLWKVASNNPPDVGKKVVVVGGGNTAVDAARTARRAGADVTILYRRTRKEMPAEEFEVDEAEREGIKFHFLAAPVSLLGSGRVEKVRAIRMELGEPDASGRRRPMPIDGSEFDSPVDTVIAAIGQKPDPTSWQKEQGPGVTRWNSVEANEQTFQTNVDWVFTGGDCLTGAATAIEAIAGGRKAAISMDRYVRDLPLLPIGKPFSDSIGRLEDLDTEIFAKIQRTPRTKGAEMATDQRLDNFDEVEFGIDKEQARAESLRCLECGCATVDSCTLRAYCQEYDVDLNRFDVKNERHAILDDHPFISYDPDKCILCGRCVRICLEQQGLGALGFVNRGFETTIRPSLERSLLNTNCDSCGQCISTCPSGAMEAKRPLPKLGPYWVRSHSIACGFCGLACRLNLEMSNGQYIQATTQPGAFFNRGNLCVDGSFGHRHLDTLERITEPQVKGKPTGWTQALSKAAKGLQDAKNGNGVAVLVNGSLTNEDAYLLSRLTRTKFTSDWIACIDEKETPLRPGVSLDDLNKADLIWVLACRPFETSPVVGVEIVRLANQGVTTLVTNASPSRLDSVATRTLRLGNKHLGTLLSALATGKTEDLLDASDTLGVKPALLAELLTCLKKAKRPVVVCDADLNDPSSQALHDLLTRMKQPNRILPLRAVGNSLGRQIMGLYAGGLPMGLKKNQLEKLWGEKTALGTSADVLAKVKGSEVDAVVVINTDPYGLPLTNQEIGKGVFSVVMDLTMSPLGQKADVLVPACSLAESEGTVVSLDGRVLPTTAARKPFGGKTLFQALGALADAMGASIPLAKPHQIWDELERVQKGLASFSHQRLHREGKLL